MDHRLCLEELKVGMPVASLPDKKYDPRQDTTFYF